MQVRNISRLRFYPTSSKYDEKITMTCRVYSDDEELFSHDTINAGNACIRFGSE